MKELTVCFTGHRPQSLGGFSDQSMMALKIKEKLKEEILKLINLGFNRFISGGALGVDQWAAEIVIELKIVYDIKLIIAKPFPSQDSIWPLSSREHFKNICNQADEVINVSPDPYKNWKMQKRNQYMIDNSKIMIAVWNGLSGGTANAVNYGKKKNIQIILINPLKI